MDEQTFRTAISASVKLFVVTPCRNSPLSGKYFRKEPVSASLLLKHMDRRGQDEMGTLGLT